jgi:colanic acid biosynthesis glycosyl transferase WcaI
MAGLGRAACSCRIDAVARITLISCVFPPEAVVSSQMSDAIASGLADRGHDVTVLAPYSSRGGSGGAKVRAWYSEQQPRERIRVIRCPVIPSRKSTMAHRLVEYVSFGCSSGLAALMIRGTSVIYANTWPVFGVGFASAAAKLRGIPLVLSVQDIYPESLAIQGRLEKTTLVFRVIHWMDGLFSRSAAHIIVIAESFRRVYLGERRIEPHRLSVIPNWADFESSRNGKEQDTAIRTQHGIPLSAFLIVYGGNIGVASGLEDALLAFAELRVSEDVFLLIAGEGDRLEECRKRAAAVGNGRVRFHTPWPQAETSDILRAADLLILPTRGNQAFASMPSKLITYMLAGRPVLAVAPAVSDLADAIRESGCGWIVPPGDPSALAFTLRNIRAMWGDEARERGNKGREFALTRFTREACLPRILGLIEGAMRTNDI